LAQLRASPLVVVAARLRALQRSFTAGRRCPARSGRGWWRWPISPSLRGRILNGAGRELLTGQQTDYLSVTVTPSPYGCDGRTLELRLLRWTGAAGAEFPSGTG